MGGKGSQTVNTAQTQTYAPDPFAYASIQGALQQAQGVAQTPFSTPVAPVAGFSGQQQQAFDITGQSQGMAQPYFNQAAQYFSPQGTQQFLNPFSSNVMASMQDVFGQQMSQTTGQLTQQAGGVGADRIAVGQAQLANQQGLAAGQTMGNLYGQAAQQAQTAAYGTANLGSAAQNATLQGAQALLGTGGLQQQLSQAQLNAPYQNILQQISWPYQNAQFLGGLTAALAPGLGGTTSGTGSTTFPPANPLTSILGLATAGAGLAGKFAARGGRIRNPFDSGGAVGTADPDTVETFPIQLPTEGSLADEPIDVAPKSGEIPDTKIQPIIAHMPNLNLNPPAPSSGSSGGGKGSSPLGGLTSLIGLAALARGGQAHYRGANSRTDYKRPFHYDDGGGVDFGGGVGGKGSDFNATGDTGGGFSDPASGLGLGGLDQYGAMQQLAQPIDVPTPGLDDATTGQGANDGSDQPPNPADPVAQNLFERAKAMGQPLRSIPVQTVRPDPGQSGMAPLSYAPPLQTPLQTPLGQPSAMGNPFAADAPIAPAALDKLRSAMVAQQPAPPPVDSAMQRQLSERATLMGGINGGMSGGFMGSPRPVPTTTPAYQDIAAMNANPMGSPRVQSDLEAPPLVPSQAPPGGPLSTPPPLLTARTPPPSTAADTGDTTGRPSLSPTAALLGHRRVFGSSPWDHLIMAGLGIMAASGQRDSHGLPLSPLSAVGSGALAGIKASTSIEEAAEKLDQAAQAHSDLYSKMTPYQSGELANKQAELKYKTDLIQAGKMDDGAARIAAETYVRTGQMPAMGYGNIGAQNRAQVWKNVTDIAAERNWTGADIAAARADFAGQMAGARTTGVRGANIDMAIAEAERTFPLLRQTSADLSRSNIVPWNKLNQLVQEGTSDPRLAKFVTAIQGARTAYSQAMSRTGVNTVHAQQNSEELLSRVTSDESLNATLDQMEQEMQAAKAAPDVVRRLIESRITGRPVQGAPAAGGSAAPAGGGASGTPQIGDVRTNKYGVKGRWNGTGWEVAQ